MFALFDNGLTGDQVGCVLLFADTGYFATAVLFALQAYGGNEVGPEACCVIRVDELPADRAGAITDANILCAAAMSVCGFSHTEIQAFVKLDVPYWCTRFGNRASRSSILLDPELCGMWWDEELGAAGAPLR